MMALVLLDEIVTKKCLSRNLFYETFKAVHYVAAAMFIVFFFLHCDFTLTSAYVSLLLYRNLL